MIYISCVKQCFLKKKKYMLVKRYLKFINFEFHDHFDFQC